MYMTTLAAIDRQESNVLAPLAQAGDALLARTLAWSAQNSHSRNLAGLARMADLISAALAPLPGTLERLDPAPVDAVDSAGALAPLAHGQNLRLTVRPDAPVQVLLAGHMDTVFPVDSGFQMPRETEAGIINGPGVTDMKGGLAVMIAALEAVEASPWAAQLGYQVIINADEEVSSLGSAPLLADAAARAQLGLVYEPAQTPDGVLAGARKGIGTYAIVAHGRAAHAGRNPQDGRNAVAAMADLFVRAHRLNGAREGLSVNVARLEGGAPTNVVPALAVGRLEMRVWDHDTRAWAEAQLRALVEAVSAEHDVALSLHGRFHRPPKPLDPATASLFAAVKHCGDDLGLPIRWQSSGGCCDGNNLAAAGLPVVDTLGVRGGAIHSDQEFLVVESLVERAQLSALLLIRLASGRIAVPPRVAVQL
jgi:glutamate carboxypeptidase